MAFVDSLEKLSLLEVSEPASVLPPLQQSPLKEKRFAAKVDGVHTDFVIIEFLNRIFILITQRPTLANLFAVSKDSPKTFEDNSENIYSVRTLFGADKEGTGTLVSRFLYEHTLMNKPALFALGLKDHSPRTVRALRDIISHKKTW